MSHRDTSSVTLIDRPAHVGYVPTELEVEALIAHASGVPDGLELLRDGALDAVAALFEVHAFVVDHARDRLSQ